MTDTITVTGLVATPIKHTTTAEGLAISSFRLASTQRRFDRATSRWADGDTNWFTVTAFRGLAENTARSLEKGHRVIVSGRMRIVDWVDGERKGYTVEIVADALGPDLAWGTAEYARSPRRSAAGESGAAAEQPTDEFPAEATDAGPVAVLAEPEPALPF